MRLSLVLLAVAVASAQENAPSGLVRGDLVMVDTVGGLDLRTSAGKLYRCYVDSRSYIEREGMRITAAALRSDERLELLADQRSGRCYARTIHVLGRNLPGAGFRPAATRRHLADLIFPRGNLTFAGVVIRRAPEILVLRLHGGGEQNILLRHDTRFMDSGFLSESGSLRPNTRVFVRGGKNLENEIEAYQIIWGEIAGPRTTAEGYY